MTVNVLSARLAGASVTKTATLLAVSREAVSRGKTPYTNGVNSSSAKKNGDRQPKQSESDRRTLKTIVSTNHKTTAA